MRRHWLINRIAGNIVFWLLYTWVHTNNDWKKFPLLALLLFVCYGIPAYVHNAYLLPQILSRKYGRYILWAILLLFTAVAVAYYTHLLAFRFFPAIDYIAYINKNSPAYHLFVCIITIILFTFGRLISNGIENQIKLEDLQKQRLESEIKNLKSQIDPHFIFNSLNTVYGLVRRTNTEAADAIIKLSNILRHSIYECSEPFIDMDKEIRVIEHYVSFAQLRINNKEAITLQVDTDDRNPKIAPLLLLPFIENAIKHGLNWDSDTSWIKIRLSLSGDNLFFDCTNSNYKLDNSFPVPDGGIGLKNVQRRLDLLYPAKHELAITETDEIYSVILKMKLS